MNQSDRLFTQPNGEWTKVAMRVDGDVYSGSDWRTYLGTVSGSQLEMREALGSPYGLPDCWLQVGWFLQVPWDVDTYVAIGRTHGLLMTQVEGVWTVVPNTDAPC